MFDLVVRAERAWIQSAWRPAAVCVQDGAVVAIADPDEELEARSDLRIPDSQVLLPGLVDTHVHVNEPGRTQWEGFASATSAAAAGGITTIVDMPLNSIPPTTTVEALEIKRDAARDRVRVDTGFWGGAIPSSLGSLRALHEAGVFGFKSFLSPSGVDEFPHLSTQELYRAMREIAEFDGLLIVHAEDPDVLARHATAGGPSFAEFVASRPDLAEEDAIAHVIAGVRETGARAHILHLSSARALDQIREAKREGLPLTAETCPHYLFFTAEEVSDGATAFKCCPPIRDAGNRDLLWDALLDGTIDLVASDHSPSTAEMKFSPGGDFLTAWGGVSGLQVSFVATWTEARERGIPLESVVRWMSEAPARLVGLDRGRIEPGAVAHLVAFDPEAERVVSAEHLAHRNKISAYDGRTLSGAVAMTWLAGEVAYSGQPLADIPIDSVADPVGQLLSRV